MKLISVIPFRRNLPDEKLTYFSAKDIAPGALVSVNAQLRGPSPVTYVFMWSVPGLVPWSWSLT